MSIKVRLCAIALLALVLCACRPYPFDQAKFDAIVKSWALEKRSPTEADFSLKEKGFKVSRHKAEKYFEDQRDYLYATQRTTIIICGLEWRVILMLEKEKIAEVKPFVFSQCI